MGFEEQLLTFIKNFLHAVGYPGVFGLMGIEGFGVPIPSEVTMPFSGFLSTAAGGNRFSLPVVIVVGAAGEVCGGIVAYLLGVYGGRPILNRYGRVVMLSEDELTRGEEWFRRYGDWVVLVTRLLPAIRSFIALPAGVVRMPFSRFLLYSTLGSLVWCTVLALIGHTLGQHWNSVSSTMSKYNAIIIAVVVLAVVVAVYRRVARRGADERVVDQTPGR